jgi:hypothetical protein
MRNFTARTPRQSGGVLGLDPNETLTALNPKFAIVVQRIVTAFAPLYNAILIQPKEFVRLVYRFVAETMPDTIGSFAPVNLRSGGCSGLPNHNPGDLSTDPQPDDPNANQ